VSGERGAGSSLDGLPADVQPSGRGKVSDIRVVESSEPGFNPAVINAISQWTFRPGEWAGGPVAARMEQPMVFSIADGRA